MLRTMAVFRGVEGGGMANGSSFGAGITGFADTCKEDLRMRVATALLFPSAAVGCTRLMAFNLVLGLRVF
jgi:hypothetical protein